MKELSNDLLLRAYERALDIQLDEKFLALLREELHERKIDLEDIYEQASSDDY